VAKEKRHAEKNRQEQWLQERRKQQPAITLDANSLANSSAFIEFDQKSQPEK
jgi:hypothetical protein